MNQHLFVKTEASDRRHVGPNQLIVANLANRLTKVGPMSEAIAVGLSCDWRLDLDGSALRNFNFASE